MYPVLLEFGIITIFSLWFFVAAGFVVSSLVFVRLAKRNRVRLTLLADHSFLIFGISLLLSRIFFILLNPDLYFYNFGFRSIFNFFALWDKGLSFWGALLGFCISLWYLAKQNKESLIKLWDIFVPAILLGMIFGDVGALLDGINYGSPTGLPWGITYRSASVKYISAVHPTQIYAVFYTGIVVVLLLIALKNLRNTIPGLVAHMGVCAFSFFKFFEEFFRGDETLKIATLRVPQLIALIVFIISGYTLYKRLTALKATGQIPAKFWKLFYLNGDLKE